MFHTFATREEAAIFASAMRAEGYFAAILDEGMGSIYGPLTIGGIRVLVSDEPLPAAVDQAGGPQAPADKAEDGELLKTLRLLVVGLAGFGLLVLAVALLSVTSQDPVGLLRMLYHFLKFPLLVGLAFAVMGPCMAGFTRFVRGESMGEGWRYLRWLLLALLIPFLLLAVL
ncbi:MAG: hypothetical protein MUF86_04670 [Akkermansiaceae bacterium]|nr:hypothetical protein [Akkermansiaceae bacterium]